jgi:small subunit ribosomal protein S1
MADKNDFAAKNGAAVNFREGGDSRIFDSENNGENNVQAQRESQRATRKKAPRTKRRTIPDPAALETTFHDLEDDEYSSEEFDRMLSEYESTIHDIKEGEVVTGRVVGLTQDDIIVDVGFKSEGIIPMEEFTKPLSIKVGDVIDVYLEAIEDQDGQLVLSKQKADFMKVWDKINEAYQNNQLIRGRLMSRIKGGIVVDLLGVDAFLPGSQIALRQIPDFDELLGKEMDFRIIKLNKSRRNIVVSRRVVLEEEREHLRDKIISEIEVGQIREGVVKNITDFGVFIDLGGVDGLLHITDMSWGRISHPTEMVSLGDEIKVKILDFDRDTNRISLGLKQLTPYPWENIEEKYPIGEIAKGKVVSITDYGAFVELEKGVEGLIHISEMSWTQHIKHPSKLVQIGDEVEAVVLSVDKENEKISLGIKQLNTDPWETLDEKYPPGMRVTGKVRNLTTFGAFVEIEEGIDGLVHISDMSWTKRIQHPSEVMKKGETIEVVILNIDKENRRVSLGLKQMEGDPWPALAVKYAPGVETRGIITRMLDRGVVVELEDDVEGFVPTNQLAKPDIEKPAEAFSTGEEIPLKVVEFDQHNRKIVLSVSAYYRDKEQDEIDAYLAKHPTRSTKVADVVGDDLTNILDKTKEKGAAEDQQPPKKQAEQEPLIEEPKEAEKEKSSGESPPEQAKNEERPPEKSEDSPGTDKNKEDEEKTREESE